MEPHLCDASHEASANVRKSSFSTLIQQQWRIPGMEMMGAVEWRGGESHTCRMICHYRGVSSQLSPPNHPTNPASQPPFAPQTPLQPSKNTSCIPQSAPVSALLPHLPLLPTLYPCERNSTLSTLCGCAGYVFLCPACVCAIHVHHYMFV